MKSVTDAHVPFENFDLNQWVEYIQTRHSRSIDMTLARVSEAWRRLGQVQPACTITIAGTNGKGSTVRILESILNSGHRKVGAYTSPHLVRFNERIRINGADASTHALCAAFCEIEKVLDGLPLTYFEYATLCALWLFARHELDIQLLEVGMGGRLDAVNIIDSNLALITSIGLDHEAWLGHDRETIALEKAEVMRAGMTAVCADRNLPESLENFAVQKAVDLMVVGRDFDVQHEHDGLYWVGKHARFQNEWARIGPIDNALSGAHQMDNLAGAVAALAVLAPRLELTVPEIVCGIDRCTLPGRCQVLSTAPLVIIDVAHNHDSALALAEFLLKQPVDGRTHAVFGTLRDKRPDQIIRPLLSQVDCWHLTGTAGERGQSSGELAGKIHNVVDRDWITCHDDPKSAYRSALDASGMQDRIVVFGSFHVAGDILELINAG